MTSGSPFGGTDFYACSPSDPPSVQHKIILGAGDYTMELKAAGSEITVGATINFIPTIISSSHPDREVGGARVAKIITSNPGEMPMVKKYFYGTYDDLNTSSLSNICGHPVYDGIQWCRVEQTSFTVSVLYSSSLLNLGFFNNGNVSYNSVVESNGENFEGGGTETKFYTGSDVLGERIMPDASGSPYIFPAFSDIPNSPFSNFSSYYNGKPRCETILKKMPDQSLKPTKKTEYFYKPQNEEEDVVYGYSVYMGFSDASLVSDTTASPGLTIPTTFSPYNLNLLEFALGNYKMMRYSVFSSWVVPEYTTENIYDENGENPIRTGTTYFYDNPDNFQLTKTESENSEGKTIRTLNKYPHDFTNTNVYSNMVDKNVITPLISKETELVIRGGTDVPLSKEKTVYIQIFNDYAPAEIQSSVKGNPLVTEGTIDIRNSLGNISQFTNKAGIKTSIIWGYDNRYPVAKIIGSDYETAFELLTVDPATFQDMDGAALLTQLNIIRTGLPQAMVTTYTYKPGVGVTSITDPNNKKNTYEYDSFGRLLIIRDQDGNIVKKNEYNYAQPNPNAGTLVYYNAALPSDPLQCQTCAAGFAPTNDPVVYTVPAGRYYSLESQAEADNLALNDVFQNAQEYANRKGVCANTAACTGEGYKFIGCGCELGTLNPATTCSGIRTDGTWDTYHQYTFSDASTASYIIPNPACTGADKKLINCHCETATKACNTTPVSNGNDSYTVNYHYHWSDNSNSTQSYTETITCSGPDKKMIGCNCETGFKVYFASVHCNVNSVNCCIGEQWQCSYKYRWSDFSESTTTYTECNSASCVGAQ